MSARDPNTEVHRRLDLIFMVLSRILFVLKDDERNNPALREAAQRLNAESDRLQAAIDAANRIEPPARKAPSMSSSVPQAVLDAVTKATQVDEAAIALINGIAARIQAAVDAAIANGATAAELAPVQDAVNALNSESDALAQAVAANTPGA